MMTLQIEMENLYTLSAYLYPCATVYYLPFIGYKGMLDELEAIFSGLVLKKVIRADMHVAGTISAPVRKTN
jgi:hypothetical protein